ncbi:MAG TPA: hypothetical protein VNA30_00105 [Mycobacteriales bacterium]|nr:hypothetical protein [Mycobacteriales bacterium]
MSTDPAGTAAPSTTSPASVTPSATAAQVPAVIAVPSRFGAEVRFQSASGNLACWLYDGGVICRATAHTWTSRATEPQTECPPAKRTSGIQLSRSGLTERSDCYDVVPEPGTVLAYGHGLELGGMRCISEERGITCRRAADGVGFSISREELSHTPWQSPLLRAPANTLDQGRTTVFPAGFNIAFLVEGLANCEMAGDRASCLVSSSASAPPGDPDCEFDQSLTAEVKGTQRGQLLYHCRSDANGGQERVAAGRGVQVGDLRCSALAKRLRCAHLGGAKHGFEVDSSSFRGF